MSLIDLIDDSKTDKNTIHSYLGLYQSLLEKKKDTAKNVLEVGIWMGGSIKLWSDFFLARGVIAAILFSFWSRTGRSRDQ